MTTHLRRALLPLSALLVLTALVLHARSAPRLVLSNAGLAMQGPPLAGLVAALAGTVLAAAAVFGRGWRRGLLALLAVGMLGLGLHQLVWRVDAGPEGLSLRTLGGKRSVAWWDVTRVDAGSEALVFTVHGGGSLRIATGSFTPEQRAALERTVSRLVGEAQRPR